MVKCNFYSCFLDFFFRRFFFFFFFFLSWSESELLEELDDEEELLEEDDEEDELELELDEEESESESELLSGFFPFLVDLKATKKHNFQKEAIVSKVPQGEHPFDYKDVFVNRNSNKKEKSNTSYLHMITFHCLNFRGNINSVFVIVLTFRSQVTTQYLQCSGSTINTVLQIQGVQESL